MTGRDELVTIESVGGSGAPLRVDRITQYEITHSLTSPSEARLELGDNGTWAAIREAIAIGRRFQLTLNDRPILTGRLLTRALPLSASAGATVQLTVRTALADAAFASCERFAVRNATLYDVVVRAYATIGLTEDRLEFQADVARNLLTGKGAGGSPPTDLAPLLEEDAQVQPPETVFAFVDRHLRRFGLIHWDSPDGKVIIGKPNDEQTPIYRAQALRSRRGNNVIQARRTEDYEQVPSSIGVYGQGGGRDYSSALARAVITDPVLTAARLWRPTVVMDDGIRTDALAESHARRELAQRSLQRDSWSVTVPGWTYRDRSGTRVPYAIDTVVDLAIDVADPAGSPCYVWSLSRSGSAGEGHTTSLTMAAKGVWQI
jgi:hypothetical protein